MYSGEILMLEYLANALESFDATNFVKAIILAERGLHISLFQALIG